MCLCSAVYRYGAGIVGWRLITLRIDFPSSVVASSCECPTFRINQHTAEEAVHWGIAGQRIPLALPYDAVFLALIVLGWCVFRLLASRETRDRCTEVASGDCEQHLLVEDFGGVFAPVRCRAAYFVIALDNPSLSVRMDDPGMPFGGGIMCSLLLSSVWLVPFLLFP